MKQLPVYFVGWRSWFLYAKLLICPPMLFFRRYLSMIMETCWHLKMQFSSVVYRSEVFTLCPAMICSRLNVNPVFGRLLVIGTVDNKLLCRYLWPGPVQCSLKSDSSQCPGVRDNGHWVLWAKFLCHHAQIREMEVEWSTSSAVFGDVTAFHGILWGFFPTMCDATCSDASVFLLFWYLRVKERAQTP